MSAKFTTISNMIKSSSSTARNVDKTGVSNCPAEIGCTAFLSHYTFISTQHLQTKLK